MVKLRKHQSGMLNVCGAILSGEPISEIICSVTPGGGKSLLPVILAENLIPVIADKICWLVPRNSLKEQGEAEFLNPHWKTNHRIRAAQNDRHLSRGFSGYITTYQAIGQNPEVHANEFQEHRYILFLDEPHHIADNSSWEESLRPLVESAVLTIFASGTLSRGDGRKIAFLEYDGAKIDLSENESRRVINYSRSDALADGAIAPIEFEFVDGEAEWYDKYGGYESVTSLEQQKTGALFTALRTEYAQQMLYYAYQGWKIYKNNHFSRAKLLIVAPNIDLAFEYRNMLTNVTGRQALIATSKDDQEAKKAIRQFKDLEPSDEENDILFTVAMAYEGLSVKPITHIACLTHIRSVSWLEQCFARGNRLTDGKTKAVIYCPNDLAIQGAVQFIETEQIMGINQRRLRRGTERSGSGNGQQDPQYHPLRSRVNETPIVMVEERHSAHIAPSQQEKYLRSNVTQHIDLFLEEANPGTRYFKQRQINRAIKAVCEKPRKEMSVDELVDVWRMLKEKYPV